MEDEFILYEEALELKKLGFNKPCLAFFDINKNALTDVYNGKLMLGKDPAHIKSENQMLYIFGQQKLLAPTYRQAFSFFREFYYTMSYIYFEFDNIFCFCIDRNDKTKGFKTYEEAELACLKKLIELAKNQ